MDRRRSRKIKSRLFWSFKIHDQIVTTWWYSSSRRCWSCKIWRLGRKVQGEVWWYFAMANWSLDNFPSKRRRTEEKGFSSAWTLILPNISSVVYCCRMVSPSTSTTSGTLTRCTPSSRADWFQEEKVSKGTGTQCFSQPWTRCTPVKIWKEFNTIWPNPELRCTKILEKFTKIH